MNVERTEDCIVKCFYIAVTYSVAVDSDLVRPSLCSVFQYSLHHNITVSLISLIVLFSLVTAVHPDSFLIVLLKTS